MKGLIISLFAFACYVIFTAVASHLLRPKRHAKLLFGSLLAWTPIYFAFYFFTPVDLGFLPPAWLANMTWLDVSYGCIIFLLNGHSYIDFFYGFNGGFSTSIIFLIQKSKNQGMSTREIIDKYTSADGTNVIYSWRLPRLAETGYIIIDNKTGTCRLTGKGRVIALLARFLKRCLNIEKGG